MSNECKVCDSFRQLSALPECTVAAMAYVPFQTDKEMFETEAALTKGTLFVELYKPFCRGALK